MMRAAIQLLPVAAFLSLLLAGCDNPQKGTTQGGPNAGTEAHPSPSVEAIRDEPGKYYGKKVGIVGSVDEVYGDRAFEMDGAEWAFNDKILVLTRSPVKLGGAAITTDDDIVVSGTVRPFVPADIEKEIGWTVPTDVRNKVGNRPVLVADAITRTGGYGAWSSTGNAQPLNTILAIVSTTDPSTLNGQKVDLGRERIQVITSKGFWVGPSRMGQVFVVPSTDDKNLKVGDYVHVSGTLKKAPKDAGKEWNLPTSVACQMDENAVYIDGATVTNIGAGAGPTGVQPGQPGANPNQGNQNQGHPGAQPGGTPQNPQNPAHPTPNQR